MTPPETLNGWSQVLSTIKAYPVETDVVIVSNKPRHMLNYRSSFFGDETTYRVVSVDNASDPYGLAWAHRDIATKAMAAGQAPRPHTHATRDRAVCRRPFRRQHMHAGSLARTAQPTISSSTLHPRRSRCDGNMSKRLRGAHHRLEALHCSVSAQARVAHCQTADLTPLPVVTRVCSFCTPRTSSRATGAAKRQQST